MSDNPKRANKANPVRFLSTKGHGSLWEHYGSRANCYPERFSPEELRVGYRGFLAAWRGTPSLQCSSHFVYFRTRANMLN
jgi:hypothetical protein